MKELNRKERVQVTVQMPPGQLWCGWSLSMQGRPESPWAQPCSAWGCAVARTMLESLCIQTPGPEEWGEATLISLLLHIALYLHNDIFFLTGLKKKKKSIPDTALSFQCRSSELFVKDKRLLPFHFRLERHCSLCQGLSVIILSCLESS